MVQAAIDRLRSVEPMRVHYLPPDPLSCEKIASLPINGMILDSGKLDWRSLAQLKVPIVDFADHGNSRPWPFVRYDQAEIGRMAAAHLLERKLDKFAFIGPAGLCHVRERLEGFTQALQEAGSKCRALLYKPLAVQRRHDSEETVDPSYLKDAVRGLEVPVDDSTTPASGVESRSRVDHEPGDRLRRRARAGPKAGQRNAIDPGPDDEQSSVLLAHREDGSDRPARWLTKEVADARRPQPRLGLALAAPAERLDRDADAALGFDGARRPAGRALPEDLLDPVAEHVAPLLRAGACTVAHGVQRRSRATSPQP